MGVGPQMGPEMDDVSTPTTPGAKRRAERRKSVRAECIKEGSLKAVKDASVMAVISTVTTLGAARYVPWVTKNINYTGRALIISAATVGTFFISAEQNILECGKRNRTYD